MADPSFNLLENAMERRIESWGMEEWNTCKSSKVPSLVRINGRLNNADVKQPYVRKKVAIVNV